jgi:hypothetical protein
MEGRRGEGRKEGRKEGIGKSHYCSVGFPHATEPTGR